MGPVAERVVQIAGREESREPTPKLVDSAPDHVFLGVCLYTVLESSFGFCSQLNFIAKFALQQVHIPAFSPIPGPLLRALGLDIQEATNPSAHSSYMVALVRGSGTCP